MAPPRRCTCSSHCTLMTIPLRTLFQKSWSRKMIQQSLVSPEATSLFIDRWLNSWCSGAVTTEPCQPSPSHQQSDGCRVPQVLGKNDHQGTEVQHQHSPIRKKQSRRCTPCLVPFYTANLELVITTVTTVWWSSATKHVIYTLQCIIMPAQKNTGFKMNPQFDLHTSRNSKWVKQIHHTHHHWYKLRQNFFFFFIWAHHIILFVN